MAHRGQMSAERSVNRRELPRAPDAGHGRFERRTAGPADAVRQQVVEQDRCQRGLDGVLADADRPVQQRGTATYAT
jgi:hypothetical protein